jgi:acetyl esterase/lipase
MNANRLLAGLLLFMVANASAQMPERIKAIFPTGTIMHQNIPYAGDTLKHHLLDIYLPANVSGNVPLVIWVHGGAWMLNDKYADMGYMKNTVKSFIESGYAFASIDYRYSTEAVFPAQIQDCNQAVTFLYNNASKYHIDKDKIALIGFSAGGHLASLLGLSNNNEVPSFSVSGKKVPFKIKAVVDFYGPANFIALVSKTEIQDAKDPLTLLLGATPLKRPDLASVASPSTYVDANDPPFLIFHGEKDESVPYTQSLLLSSYLNLAKVKNEITIVPGAPHYGEMYDVDAIRNKISAFLKTYLN